MSRSEGEDRIEVLANVAQSPMAVLVGGDDVLHRTREGATVPAHTTMWVRGT